MSRNKNKTAVYVKLVELAASSDAWPGNAQAGRWIGPVSTKVNRTPLSGVQIGSYMSDLFDWEIIGDDQRSTYKGRQFLRNFNEGREISNFLQSGNLGSQTARVGTPREPHGNCR